MRLYCQCLAFPSDTCPLNTRDVAEIRRKNFCRPRGKIRWKHTSRHANGRYFSKNDVRRKSILWQRIRMPRRTKMIHVYDTIGFRFNFIQILRALINTNLYFYVYLRIYRCKQSVTIAVFVIVKKYNYMCWRKPIQFTYNFIKRWHLNAPIQFRWPNCRGDSSRKKKSSLMSPKTVVVTKESPHCRTLYAYTLLFEFLHRPKHYS